MERTKREEEERRREEVEEEEEEGEERYGDYLFMDVLISMETRVCMEIICVLCEFLDSISRV